MSASGRGEMQGSTAAWLGVLGIALCGCGDDSKPARISQQTSWQVGCVAGGSTCGASRDAHRPAEDVEIDVRCDRDPESGLNLTLTDPGQEPTGVGVRARASSKLTITRLDPETGRCFVDIEEKDRATGGLLRVSGMCGSDGACRVAGAFDRNGWDFDGTIVCSGLRQNGEGPPDFRLQAAASSGEPAVLQLANCK